MLSGGMAIADTPVLRMPTTRKRQGGQLTEYAWLILVSRAGIEPATTALKVLGRSVTVELSCAFDVQRVAGTNRE
jgi:hypothetical protein